MPKAEDGSRVRKGFFSRPATLSQINQKRRQMGLSTIGSTSAIQGRTPKSQRIKKPKPATPLKSRMQAIRQKHQQKTARPGTVREAGLVHVSGYTTRTGKKVSSYVRGSGGRFSVGSQVTGVTSSGQTVKGKLSVSGRSTKVAGKAVTDVTGPVGSSSKVSKPRRTPKGGSRMRGKTPSIRSSDNDILDSNPGMRDRYDRAMAKRAAPITNKRQVTKALNDVFDGGRSPSSSRDITRKLAGVSDDQLRRLDVEDLKDVADAGEMYGQKRLMQRADDMIAEKQRGTRPGSAKAARKGAAKGQTTDENYSQDFFDQLRRENPEVADQMGPRFEGRMNREKSPTRTPANTIPDGRGAGGAAHYNTPSGGKVTVSRKTSASEQGTRGVNEWITVKAGNKTVNFPAHVGKGKANEYVKGLIRGEKPPKGKEMPPGGVPHTSIRKNVLAGYGTSGKRLSPGTKVGMGRGRSLTYTGGAPAKKGPAKAQKPSLPPSRRPGYQPPSRRRKMRRRKSARSPRTNAANRRGVTDVEAVFGSRAQKAQARGRSLSPAQREKARADERERKSGEGFTYGAPRRRRKTRGLQPGDMTRPRLQALAANKVDPRSGPAQRALDRMGGKRGGDSNPRSNPGRGPTGKVRNFRSMSDEKFEREAEAILSGNPDAEVKKALSAEATRRAEASPSNRWDRKGSFAAGRGRAAPKRAR